MNIVVTALHQDGTEEATKQHARTHVEKLTRYYDLIQEIRVTLDHGRQGHDGHRCEIIVDAEHKNEFVADAHDDKPIHAVDACIEKLKRQLSEHKEKHKNRKHPH